jgi:predicted nucleic acid-binding protein
VIVADTGAIIALIDADDSHHEEMVELYESDPGDWVLPWAILPEVDYIVGAHVGERAQRAFVRDVATGAFSIEWGNYRDIARAQKLCDEYRSLKLGLVDAVVAATAERLKASAIATIDLRDFGPLKLAGGPKLLPRDR